MSKDKGLGLKPLLRDADPATRADLLAQLPYEVGFGKPPQETRFSSSYQPQRRGRRRKRAEEAIAVLAEELSRSVEVVENGKRQKLSKLRVGMRQIANKMAAGDLKALNATLELLRKGGRLGPTSPAGLQNHQLDVEQIRANMRNRLNRLVEAALEESNKKSTK
jgi:hypothetical protein